MHKNYAIVTLSRYPQYVRKLIQSIQLTHKSIPPIVVICDRHIDTIEGAQNIYTTDDFIFARNANRGINYFPGHDIILINDDMECVEKDFFHKLASIAWKYPKCGLLSPLIDGGVGNPLQQYPQTNHWDDISVDTIGISGTDSYSLPICFPCVYISRKLIDDIGLLDENFTGYGGDDNDYCIRARRAGWLTMITRSLRIKHGDGGNHLHRGYNWSCSFARELTKPSNEDYLHKKYPAQK